jgi:hypothetical protein
MSEAREQAAVGVLARWFKDPVRFVREALGAEPEPYQRDVLAAVARSPQTALVGSKGTGKTTTLAWTVLWFLATRPHANIAATSVSADLLRDSLWKELARWLQGSPVLSAQFEWQQTRIVNRANPATWWASARQWSRSADAQQQSEALAGLHAERTMFVLDEAGSMPMSLLATAQAALSSGRECKLIIAGNPTSREGPLYAAYVTHRGQWETFHISGAPDDPKRSSRVSVEWAQNQIDQYGAESPWVRVNVFGEFPETSLNALLGPEDVQRAMSRHMDRSAFVWSQKRLGVDVARFGMDRTCIFPRQGLASFKPLVMRHARDSSVSTDIAARVAKAIKDWGAEATFMDATGGWAAGAVDVLRAGGIHVIECQFHAPASDPRYKNLRAEMWFQMAEWVKRGGALPDIPELVGELTTPEYSYCGGKFQLEPKDNVKARLGRSPDLADALCMTFAFPDMPAESSALWGRQSIGRAITDDPRDDPFADRSASFAITDLDSLTGVR